MIRGVDHECGIRNTLPPQSAIARRGISQRHAVLGREAVDHFHVGARVVVKVSLRSHIHEAVVVRGQDNPLRANALEIKEELAVMPFHRRYLQHAVVYEFGNHQIRPGHEHRLREVADVAGRCFEEVRGVVRAPADGDEYDVGFGKTLLEPADELRLPLIFPEIAFGHTVAPRENFKRLAAAELRHRFGQEPFGRAR